MRIKPGPHLLIHTGNQIVADKEPSIFLPVILIFGKIW